MGFSIYGQKTKQNSRGKRIPHVQQGGAHNVPHSEPSVEDNTTGAACSKTFIAKLMLITVSVLENPLALLCFRDKLPCGLTTRQCSARHLGESQLPGTKYRHIRCQFED